MKHEFYRTTRQVIALALVMLVSSVPAFAGLTIVGSNGITASGADGIIFNGTSGITASGADGILAFGPNGITASGADGITASGADGITASGADSTTITRADGITASGADGITISGADGSQYHVDSVIIRNPTGITASGADNVVSTGTNALIAALNGTVGQTGLQSVDPELAVLLNRLTDDSNVDAVVVYHHLPNDADIADLQRLGVPGGTRYRVLPMIAVSCTKAQIAAISHLASVRSIYGNRTFQWNLEPAARNLTGVERVRRNADLTRSNRGLPVSGRGVTVAVLDTGVDGTHGDLAGRVVQNLKLADTQSVGVGFNYPVTAPSLPNTDQAYGHGTFVAGIIAGNGQQSGGKYAGVAPGANILGLSAGDASLLFVLSGFDYLLANGSSFGVRVVNCSFSANTVFDVNDPVNIATRMLTDSGISVVFSAGNNGSGLDSLNPYSVAPWVISTGATDDQGRLANFSSRGDFGSPLFRPTLVAPGVNTVSLRASAVAAVTTIDGLLGADPQLSTNELPYYTTGSGTSFSTPQVAGVVALMLEANPQLTPAQIRDILQRTATPLPQYYVHEVGAGLLNAQAAVLEAAFPERRFGQWRGAVNCGQVQFVSNPPEVFTGTVTPGLYSDSSITLPANTLLASVQIAWGGLLSPNNLELTLLDSQDTKQAYANTINLPGLTGRRQRVAVNMPTSGIWKAVISNTLGPAGTSQTYSGVLELTSARYAPMTDVSSLDTSLISEIYQNFRSAVMWPFGQRFRPDFAVTRADLAGALVLGARVPQYLPGQSNYTDVRDRATMLFVESAQASPNGSLFPNVTPGGPFQPDGSVDRLTAVIALVRAAGLRTQAESGTYTLTYTDAASIPANLRGYVAVAVQNGLIRTTGKIGRAH